MPAGPTEQSSIGRRFLTMVIHWKIKAMTHRTSLNVDLEAWVYGAIEKHRQGDTWRRAWFETYREIEGMSETSGQKDCPRIAARTLYQLGRLEDGGLPFRTCDIPEL